MKSNKLFSAMQKITLDVSDELHIRRFRQGIQLIRPEFKIKNTLQTDQSLGTIGSLLLLPFSIYFDNAHGVIQKINEHDAELCGFDSAQHATGKIYCSSFTSKSRHLILENDRQVMRSGKAAIFEEDILHNDNTNKKTLSIKLPWYNGNNQVVGLFGCSITLGKHQLGSSMALISRLGLLNNYDNTLPLATDEIIINPLPKQQLACAKLLLAGMTTKEMAIKLSLSPRTIETYVDNLKSKFKCRNKTELVAKLSRIMS